MQRVGMAWPREGWRLEDGPRKPFDYASLYRREYLFKPYVTSMGHAVTPPSQSQAVIQVDRFVPNFAQACENCGETPTVMAMKDGKVVYQGTMCGPCTWGDADMADPNKWNE